MLDIVRFIQNSRAAFSIDSVDLFSSERVVLRTTTRLNEVLEIVGKLREAFEEATMGTKVRCNHDIANTWVNGEAAYRYELVELVITITNYGVIAEIPSHERYVTFVPTWEGHVANCLARYPEIQKKLEEIADRKFFEKRQNSLAHSFGHNSITFYFDEKYAEQMRLVVNQSAAHMQRELKTLGEPGENWVTICDDGDIQLGDEQETTRFFLQEKPMRADNGDYILGVIDLAGATKLVKILTEMRVEAYFVQLSLVGNHHHTFEVRRHPTHFSHQLSDDGVMKLIRAHS